MERVKLYSPRYVQFSGLRMGVGDGLGVIFDVDTVVIRKAMRVIGDYGIRWQFLDRNMFFYIFNESDQICIDDYEEGDLKFVSKREYYRSLFTL